MHTFCASGRLISTGHSTARQETLTNGVILPTMKHGHGRISTGEYSSLALSALFFLLIFGPFSYFTKFEKFVDDPLYPDVNSKVKGNDGPVRVGYFNTVSDGSKDFIEACVKAGIPYSADFNTPPGARGVNRVSIRCLFFGKRF